MQPTNVSDAWSFLSNEIIAFYNFLKPQQYDHRSREEILSRVRYILNEEYPHARVKIFGSYPCGIYLPRADMDLVIFTEMCPDSERLPSRKNKINKFLWRFQAKLGKKDYNLISPYSPVVVISKAKVPLLKFKDWATNLDVDISFDNYSGLRTHQTYDAWLHRYPTIMAALVSLIKLFLHMHMLYDPACGGMGGFTICSLVVFMLWRDEQSRKHFPGVSSGLGRLLVLFFHTYGFQINFRSDAIDMSQMRLIEKPQACQPVTFLLTSSD